MGWDSFYPIYRDVTDSKFGAKGTFIYFPLPPSRPPATPNLVGDSNDLPVIKISPLFVGLRVIQSDVYFPNYNGDEWYIEVTAQVQSYK